MKDRVLGRGREEAGFTIVEGVVASLLIAVGGLAVLQVFDAGARNTFRAEQSQVVVTRLQSELERIETLPYAEIAMNCDAGCPSSQDEDDPRSRMVNSSLVLARNGTQTRPLAYKGGPKPGGGTVTDGQVEPGPTPFESGDVSGNIYRFVAWDEDPATCSVSNCSDLKRIVVMATVDDAPASFPRAYQEVHTQVSNPDATGPTPGNPCPDGDCDDDHATPWTFWITDTPAAPCSQSTRQPIAGDHQTHNTRGACGTARTGVNNPGAPDLMFAKPYDGPADQPPPHFSTELVPNPDPGDNYGLQLRHGPPCSDLTNIWGSLPVLGDAFDTTYYQKVHKWISPPIPNGSWNILFNGNGGMDLWTRTVNGVAQPGRICVSLFYRQINALGFPIDTPAANLGLSNATYFPFSCPITGQRNPQCEQGWPTEWKEIHIPLKFFLGAALTPGTRLGVALSVDGNQTGDKRLGFRYDEPGFDSRVQVETSSALPSL